jgi:hypothetical protein
MATGPHAASPEILAALERGAAILRDLMIAHGLVQRSRLTPADVQGLSGELNTKLHQELPQMDQTTRFQVTSATRADDWPLGRWRCVIAAEREETVGTLEVGLEIVSSAAE